MLLDEAKEILKENDYIVEDYNFYKNPQRQMAAKRKAAALKSQIGKYEKLINKSSNLDELISALQVIRDNMGSIPVNFEDTSISITNWDDEWNLWIESDGVE